MTRSFMVPSAFAGEYTPAPIRQSHPIAIGKGHLSSIRLQVLPATILLNDTSWDHRLGLVVVELHREGEHQRIQVLVQRREVEAEHMTRRFDLVGLLLGFDWDVAEHTRLGSVGDARELVLRSRRHWNRRQYDRGRVAVDEVVGGFLSDGGLSVLFELANDLLSNERAKQDRTLQDIRAGVVDRRKDKGRSVDRTHCVGEQGRVRALRRRISIGLWSNALGIRDEAARIEVCNVQQRIMKALRNVWIRLIGGLGLSRNADEEEQKTWRKTKLHPLIVAPGRGERAVAERDIPWRNALHFLPKSQPDSDLIRLRLSLLGRHLPGDALRGGCHVAVPSRGCTISVCCAVTSWTVRGSQTQDVAHPAGVRQTGDHRSVDAGLRQYLCDLGRTVHPDRTCGSAGRLDSRVRRADRDDAAKGRRTGGAWLDWGLRWVRRDGVSSVAGASHRLARRLPADRRGRSDACGNAMLDCGFHHLAAFHISNQRHGIGGMADRLRRRV